MRETLLFFNELRNQNTESIKKQTSYTLVELTLIGSSKFNKARTCL